MNVARDDSATVTAVAVLAACTSDLAHEVIGHGGACLGAGGHIALLNAAFFKCSPGGRYVALAGPVANLVVGATACLAQPAIPVTRPAVRLYVLLVMAFSLFWEAGYVIEAMMTGSGDAVFAWRELVGADTLGARVAAVGMGVAAYMLVTRLLITRAAGFADAHDRASALLRRPALAAASGEVRMVEAAGVEPASEGTSP